MTDQAQPPTATASDVWTVKRLLEWTTDFFSKRGSASPRLDAEILLANARDCSRIELYTDFDAVPDEKQRVAFREMVRRRGEGMPVAQLVGYREFYSLRLRVNEHVLIPRPETEHLVVEALDFAKPFASQHGRPPRIIDLGTGSGAIAIAVAKNLPEADVLAVDSSTQALEIAAWNIQQHQLDDRIKLLESDWFSAVDSDQQFDLVCSNPPYISQAEFQQLDKTVKDFEPTSALVSGARGTECIEKILDQSPPFLNPGARLLMELSPMIADACSELVAERTHYVEPKFIKDLAGHRRVLSVVFQPQS